MLLLASNLCLEYLVVSILTRAEARVLHDAGGDDGLPCAVSILTRAEARVLPSASNAMNCNV